MSQNPIMTLKHKDAIKRRVVYVRAYRRPGEGNDLQGVSRMDSLSLRFDLRRAEASHLATQMPR